MLLSDAVKEDHDILVQAYQHISSASSEIHILHERKAFMTSVASCCTREKQVLLPVIEEFVSTDSEKRLERYRLDYISVRDFGISSGVFCGYSEDELTRYTDSEKAGEASKHTLERGRFFLRADGPVG